MSKYYVDGKEFKTDVKGLLLTGFCDDDKCYICSAAFGDF